MDSLKEELDLIFEYINMLESDGPKGVGDKTIYNKKLLGRLSDIENYADKKLPPHDIVLTDTHFVKRVMDPRNYPKIRDYEIRQFIARLAKNKEKFDEFVDKYNEFVVSDKRSDLTIPFINKVNGIIAKTIMRNPRFLTTDPVLKIENKQTDKFVKVRFNLGRGKNYMKWQIKYPDGKILYENPDNVNLVLNNCMLKNNKKTAEKIFEGQNKQVCAWILCESVSISRNINENKSILEGVQIKYNPKLVPNWVSVDGKNIDNSFFSEIRTYGNKIFLV
jgi:hypothetical protein